MKGLELSRRYYEEHGKLMVENKFPEYASRIAFGLCGEGSECLGFDDEISQDHDFGPAFCMWLTDEDYEKIGDRLNEEYKNLPKIFLDYKARDIYSSGEQRVGAMRISDYYRKFTGLDRAPESIMEWRRIPEHFLSIVTSGEVFRDDLGVFSGIRKSILDFYPEDIRIKKLVARIAIMGQAGQYNYPRCIKRGERIAAICALAEFIRASLSAIYLINKKYMPYYKWAHRGLKDLPILGNIYNELNVIADNCENNSSGVNCKESDLISKDSEDTGKNGEISSYTVIENTIEIICLAVLDVLREQNLTDETDSFLMAHCESMMQRIQDNDIRRMSIFAE